MSTAARRNAFKMNLATFISNAGDGMHTLAIGQILYERSGSVAAFGLIITLNYLLGIACQIYAGPLVDRLHRKRLIVAADLGRGLLVLALAVCVGRGGNIAWIVALSLLIKMGTHLYRPAYFAMVPEAIPSAEIPAFNAMNTSCMQAGQLIGMAAFGVLYAWGPATVFVADAATFLISACITRLTIFAPAHAPTSPTSVVESWREALRSVKADKGLLMILGLSASLFLIYQIEEMAVVPFVAHYFGGNKLWLSVFQGAFSLGCVASVSVLKFQSNDHSAPVWMTLQALAVGGLLLAGGSGIFATATFFLMGIASTVAAVQLLNRLMKRSPDALKGRISSLRLLFISVLISTLVPGLTALLAKSLSWGLLGSMSVLLGFAALGFATNTSDKILTA